jgi:hypothetical protein
MVNCFTLSTTILMSAYSVQSSLAFLSIQPRPIQPLCTCAWAFSNNKKMMTVQGPLAETKPDYENIHGPLGPHMDALFMKLFRSRMAEHVGVDSDKPQDDYMGLMELTSAMNARYSDRSQVQRIAQDVLSEFVIVVCGSGSGSGVDLRYS